MNINEISGQIVDAAIAIHRELGPGLLESVYEVVLAHELKNRSFEVNRQVVVPIEYQGLRFDEGSRDTVWIYWSKSWSSSRSNL